MPAPAGTGPGPPESHLARTLSPLPLKTPTGRSRWGVRVPRGLVPRPPHRVPTMDAPEGPAGLADHEPVRRSASPAGLEAPPGGPEAPGAPRAPSREAFPVADRPLGGGLPSAVRRRPQIEPPTTPAWIDPAAASVSPRSRPSMPAPLPPSIRRLSPAPPGFAARAIPAGPAVATPAPSGPVPSQTPAPSEPIPSQTPAPSEPIPSQTPAPSEPIPSQTPAPSEPIPSQTPAPPTTSAVPAAPARPAPAPTPAPARASRINWPRPPLLAPARAPLALPAAAARPLGRSIAARATTPFAVPPVGRPARRAVTASAPIPPARPPAASAFTSAVAPPVVARAARPLVTGVAGTPAVDVLAASPAPSPGRAAMTNRPPVPMGPLWPPAIRGSAPVSRQGRAAAARPPVQVGPASFPAGVAARSVDRPSSPVGSGTPGPGFGAGAAPVPRQGTHEVWAHATGGLARALDLPAARAARDRPGSPGPGHSVAPAHHRAPIGSPIRHRRRRAGRAAGCPHSRPCDAPAGVPNWSAR